MRIFIWQRISAIALVIFLTIHMIVLHYPPFHIDFSRVVERLDQPLWKAIDIAFLFFVLVHALLGAYMVLTDVERLDRSRRILAGLAVIIGIIAFVYGTITIMAFEPPAAVSAAIP
jgi:succinate dehydrogenase / fumarate reductase membrane anchor subunit